jgi:hypothetical protein
VPRKKSIKLPEESSENPDQLTGSFKTSTVSSLQRFVKSMKIDYEKWHDGIGYDIGALKLASPIELKEIEQILIRHKPRDWRDIEALAKIDTKRARETLNDTSNQFSYPERYESLSSSAPNWSRLWSSYGY